MIPAAQLLPEVPDAGLGPYLQLWPHRHGTDAMFAAYLRKTPAHTRVDTVALRIMPSILSADFANLQTAIE